MNSTQVANLKETIRQIRAELHRARSAAMRRRYAAELAEAEARLEKAK